MKDNNMKKYKIFLMINIIYIFSFTNSFSEWFVFENKNLPNSLFYGVTLDKSQNLWYWGYDVFYKKMNDTWITFDSIGLHGLYDLYIDDRDVIWACGDAGILKIENGILTRKTPMTSNIPVGRKQCILPFDENIILVGSESSGIIKFDRNTLEFLDTINVNNSILKSNDITCMNFDKTGMLWIGTTYGLLSLQDSNWTLYNTTNSGIKDNVILCMAVDSLNNIWVGTDWGGVCMFDRENWTNYDRNNSPITNNRIIDIGIDKNNNKWIACRAVIKFDDINWEIYTTQNSPLPNWAIMGIVIDSNNNKWIGTGNGLAVYNEDKVIFTDVIESDSIVPKIKNYPNPVSNHFNFDYTLEKNANVNLSICDLNGKVLRVVIDNQEEAGAKQVNVDISDLPAGSYYCILKVNGTATVNKLIKKD